MAISEKEFKAKLELIHCPLYHYVGLGCTVHSVEGEGEGAKLATMEQLDFVEELLDGWRDTSANQLAAAATEE
ncbi:hypothetical protein BJY52DRAFT_1191232 [Lactarius psammicola]|nr:hypothetical protein BJY52DRAFT_1191232 [Lactarius psammicola]